MNNSIFELLKIFSTLNQSQNFNSPSQQNSNVSNNYPFEAFSNNQQTNNNNLFSNNNENNLLPLLMSMLSKNGDLSNLFTQNIKNDDKVIKKEGKTPNNEILL